MAFVSSHSLRQIRHILGLRLRAFPVFESFLLAAVAAVAALGICTQDLVAVAAVARPEMFY
jgi:hypothetical protein